MRNLLPLLLMLAAFDPKADCGLIQIMPEFSGDKMPFPPCDPLYLPKPKWI